MPRAALGVSSFGRGWAAGGASAEPPYGTAE